MCNSHCPSSVVEQVKASFAAGTLEKALLGTLSDNCAKALDFFSKPKRMCVTKLAELNTLSTPVAAMKLFAATAAKKSATQEEFSKCFLACSSAGVVVPGAHRLLQSLGVPVVPTCCCSAVELAHERLRSLGRLQRLHASFCFLSRPLPKHPIQFE